ncbi:MAG TPA: outer membrane lipoprotein-sorting protein [Candidatus Binatia bacterium]|nr:outer membrane lipoprotein-sorting protein [Candidatus Binatia bacterium]
MRHYRLALSVAALVSTVALAGIAQAASVAAKPARTLRDIHDCMAKNLTKKGALRDLSATVTDREGKSRKLRMRLFWKPTKGGSHRINLRLTEPAPVAGSSYLLLVHGSKEDVWFSLPATDKPLHVTGKNMSEPLWGTDFSYGEIKQVLGLVATGDVSLKADTQVAGRPAYVLESEGGADETGYQKVTSYVDRQSCTLLKSEFHEKAGGPPRKVLEADVSTLLQADVYWAMLGYTMKDLAQGTQTKLELTDLSFDERLPESLFTPEHFFEPYR